MGSKTRRLNAFLAHHPICCYCGGIRGATTQDHFPPRSVFTGRQWPVGYVFPACDRCNAATADDESIVALLARIYPEAKTREEQEETTKIMAAMAERHLDVFQSLFPSVRTVRKWMKETGFTLAPGATTRDAPIMSIEHPRIHEAVTKFASKLFCSLYYMHVREILSPAGGIVFRWFSNAQNLDELLPRDTLAPMLGSFPKLERQGTSLNDEFFYRYGIATDTGRAGVFLVFFRQSIAMLGFIFPDISTVKVPDGAEVLRPLG